jgi:hypothetical protein
MRDSGHPPEIDDARILAYLDGEADPETSIRIERSETYRRRARELDRLQKNLRARLYRSDCPDPQVLGEYQLGFLGTEQARAVAAHLVDCPHCAGELADLRAFLREEAIEGEPGPAGLVQRLVARLVSGGPAMVRPALGLRGEQEETFIYEAEGVQVALEVQPEPDDPERRTLIGLITGLPREGLQVKILKNGEEIARASVDELHNFVLSGLPSGEYEIVLTIPELEVRIPTFQI